MIKSKNSKIVTVTLSLRTGGLQCSRFKKKSQLSTQIPRLAKRTGIQKQIKSNSFATKKKKLTTVFS
jgi:hypothetical protein